MPERPEKTLEQVVEEVGLYPVEAYEFLQHGLAYTVHKVHGENPDPNTSRHVSGRQLCEGLRDFALMQWGLLAGTVLRRWNIHRTEDFGRMVFALVEAQLLAKTEQDSADDFRDVFDFNEAFDQNYRIECKS